MLISFGQEGCARQAGVRLVCFSKAAEHIHQHFAELAGVVRLRDEDRCMNRPLRQLEQLLQQLLHHRAPLQGIRS